MAIVGLAVVSHVESSTAESLWPRVRKAAQLSKKEYFEYFSGKAEAFAIHLIDARQLKRPISLKEARRIAPNFQPPQSWCYLENLPRPLVLRIARAATA